MREPSAGESDSADAAADTVLGELAPSTRQSAATDQTVLGKPVRGASDRGGAPAGSEADTVAGERAGRVRAPDIPGYRVLGVLGEGGMGTVYAGEQQSPRRPVAIKVLHARSPSVLARFRAEAEIMARLDHPGIARVLEAGDADGHPFLVMEHIDGVTLDRHAQPLGRRERLAQFTALCDAVHHAHVHGVIHRDLKPVNVMVRPDGRVVVLDFGVARLAGDGDATSSTQAGELIGTPLYMSPEQARLRPDEVDARSDVYTLGVMLYELVCDELPYPVRGVPLAALAGMICEDEPVRLARRDPRLRGDLDAIADKALRKLPTERYQSAAVLGDDVRRFLDGAPVSVRSPGTIEQLRRFVRRRPMVAAAVAAAALALAAFAIIVTELWLAADRARDVAEAAQRRTEAARAELEVRTDELTLRQARAALARDPTEALAWLATLTGARSRALDPAAAWWIFDEAVGRGVASHVLRGHTGEVHWIEGIPGSADFATASYDGRAIVWQAPAYQPRIVFQAAHGRARLVRPSPDGARLAIGSDEGGLHIVTRDGSAVAALAGHLADVQHMVWSPDGAWLATGDNAGGVWLWPGGKAPGRPLRRTKAAVSALAASPDGTTLVAGDHAGALSVWRIAGGEPIDVHVGTDVIDVWTDGARVIAVDGDGTVRTWRIAGGGLGIERTVATGAPTKRVVFFSGGAGGGEPWLVLGGVTGVAVRVAGDAVETIAVHRDVVRYIAVAADGRRIATASDDGVLQVMDRVSGRRTTLPGHSGRIRHVAFAGNALVSADGEGVVRRWDIDAMPVSVLEVGAPVERMAASRDGRQLATVDDAGDVALWTLGEPAHPAPSDGGRARLGRMAGHVSAIALAGAAPLAVTGDAAGQVTWWTTPPVNRAMAGIVRSIAASADRVAVATTEAIGIFTLEGEPVATLPGNTGGTEAIAFDPSGGLLAAGGQDRWVRVYRVADGAQIAELPGPSGDTHFVAFTPSGDRLLAASNDGAVYGWPVAAGRIDAAGRLLLARHTGAPSALAVSFDGRWLASAARDDLIQRRALPSGAQDVLAIRSTASAIAFDAAGDVRAVTRGGAVVYARAGAVSTVNDHGARAGLAIHPDRLAVALDDGTIVIEPIAPRTLAQLSAALARTTTYRLSDAP